VQDALGNYHTTSYDPAGRKISDTDPLGHVTQYAYDPARNLVGVIDANSHITTAVYDVTNRAIAAQNAVGYLTTFLFDSAGNNIATVNARGFTATTAYDARNSVLWEQNALGAYTSFVYDPAMNQIVGKDPRGFAVTYTYDVLNREAERLYPDSTTASTSYDPVSRKTLIAGAGGASTFVYDLAGRTAQYTAASRVGYSYSYDGNANRTVKVEAGTTFTTYVYDPFGNLSSISNVQAGLNTYTYDALNREYTRTSADGTILTHTYDQAGRETAKLATAHGAFGSPLENITATYDYVGNRTAISMSAGGQPASRVYSYDAANQVIVDTNSTTQFTTSFVYDPAGNRIGSGYTNGGGPVLLTTYTYNPANAPITSIETTSTATTITTYSYDSAGNRTVQNVNGALTAFAWDYENRMLGVVQPAGTSVTNTYLPNNRIVKATDASGNLTTLTYDISGANLIRRDVGGTSPATEHYTQPSKDFGGLLAQVSTANSSARFYLPDLSRNIGVLANGSTVGELHLLQAFGLDLPGSSAPTTQPYGFHGDAGVYTDPITGLVIMWNRPYDPNVGQFLNPDPIGLKGGDPNFRRIALNNPVRWVDPNGTAPSALCLIPCVPCAACGIDYLEVCGYCGTNLQCWQRCIQGVNQNLPTWLKVTCGAACIGCIACLLGTSAPPPPPPPEPPVPPEPWDPPIPSGNSPNSILQQINCIGLCNDYHGCGIPSLCYIYPWGEEECECFPF
jgi:RHS repeat-associated protein